MTENMLTAHSSPTSDAPVDGSYSMKITEKKMLSRMVGTERNTIPMSLFCL